MTSSAHPDDLLGAYATGSCTPEETTRVATHAAACDACTAEIEKLADAARWIGAGHAEVPLPQGLKARVLSAAFQARPAREPATGVHLDPYVVQVTAFGRLIAGLDEPEWLLPTGPYTSVREMVGHLTGNDRLVAADLGLSAGTRGWQEQADELLRAVAGSDTRILARPVRLAGGGVKAPLRDALTQRAFETWIHADDIRVALRLPVEAPPPEHVARIVEFGLRLLPGAMDAAGRAHPGRCARLVLTGAGGGEHVVPLAARGSCVGGPEAAEIVLPAVRFCRLMAGRAAAGERDLRITGDHAVAADVLAVAATLGCD
ncbi:hypothetical protein Val02_81000 [Virgisporangium aliadipatigenens]|uniref:Putative zinc-finger domain-containing protein n=1 Tax=Virgisporangium aliadipatigenens TaxID=741659 RepID=A0A8J3YSU1_9ACTN|nr:maleylpyruvate isomerase family mycothiol-dependent enzyme [Virgisporangium aliadipatigenens]GIJ51214.1 hypothetical protein Val02_81000 [Virgisporangium aliadipatigenens]